jgi:hypothetical protein
MINVYILRDFFKKQNGIIRIEGGSFVYTNAGLIPEKFHVGDVLNDNQVDSISASEYYIIVSLKS